MRYILSIFVFWNRIVYKKVAIIPHLLPIISSPCLWVCFSNVHYDVFEHNSQPDIINKILFSFSIEIEIALKFEKKKWCAREDAIIHHLLPIICAPCPFICFQTNDMMCFEYNSHSHFIFVFNWVPFKFFILQWYNG